MPDAEQGIAKGREATLLPLDTELTPPQAAALLRISRPSLTQMLDENKLPYRQVGAHRRVRYEDLLRYLDAEQARRKNVMEELVAETERLGLYECADSVCPIRSPALSGSSGQPERRGTGDPRWW